MRTLGSAISRLIVAVLCLGFLAGCSMTQEPTGFWGRLWSLEVGPNYRQPQVPMVNEFRSQVGPAEGPSLADLAWWQVFNDKVLQRLLADALAHNYDLETAVARVEQARALVGVAASQLYPQAGYQAFADREKSFVPFGENDGNPTFNNFAGLFGAVWELDVWGRIRRSTEAARANLFAQEYVRRGVMLTLVSDVASGYFRLLELDRELAIAHESIHDYKETLDLFSRRYEFGRDSKLSVARAQAAYDASEANIAALNRAITQQENALSVLGGNYPQPIPRGRSLTEQTASETPLGTTTDVLHRRPDIMQAEQTMIGANAQIGVAVANFLPRIGLSALYGGQAKQIGDVFNGDFSIWNIAANISGPLFQGGRLLETYYAQQAFWDQTVAQYKQTILVAFKEVSDELVAQRTLAAQRGDLEGQVTSLRESVDLAVLRYNAGRASYFEVLEAEQLLFPAEDALAQTQRDQLLAVVGLYKALGGGWSLSDHQWVHGG